MSDFALNFPASIHEKLGYYVYAYVNTRDAGEEYVYIGKGKGDRCFSHVKAALENPEESVKQSKIYDLYHNGNLRIDIVAFGVDEDVAMKIEASIIDILGVHNLENVNRGHGSREYGRKTTQEVIAELCPDEIQDKSYFTEDVILIRLRKEYFSGISSQELYDWTRGVWKASMRSVEKTKYALAISGGIVREVYEIAGWFKGGSTAYFSRESFPEDESWQERVEFVGRVADDTIRNKYIWKDISKLYSNGEQNPIKYVGPSFTK